MGNSLSVATPPYDADCWHSASEDEDDDEVESPQPLRESAGAAATPSAASGASAKDSQAEPEPLPWTFDLCGLEPIPGATKWEGPQRFKTSPLSEEEKARCRAYLDRLFDKETVRGKKLIFSVDEINDIVHLVLPILEAEPVLIEDVPFDVTIVGNLHGQFYDLDRLFRGDSKDGKPGWECMKYVFLGDYVDKGRQSTELVMALFCIKCLHPDRIFLLRGHHEFYKTNKRNGLLTDCVERYTELETGKYVYMKINEAFCWLSIAAIVGNIYFCAHGGISTSGFTRRQMRGVYKPIMMVDEDTLVRDICTSEPAEGLRGTMFNKDSHSIYFGFDACCHALASMEVVAIFRSHSRISTGHSSAWNVCHTVFTATNFERSGNPGAVAYVDAKGRVEFAILEVDEGRAEWEARLRAIEYLPDKPEKKKAGK